MKNPLTALMEDRGWNVSECAIVLGVTEAQITNIVRGAAFRLSERLILSLNAAGFEGEVVAGSYRAWRIQRREELLARPLKEALEPVEEETDEVVDEAVPQADAADPQA